MWVVFSKNIFTYLLEAFKNRVFLDRNKLARWIASSYTAHILSNSTHIKKFIRQSSKQSVFYFFWARESAEVIPFVPQNIRIACRFHAYDLYEKDFGYLPFQSQQVKRANLLLPCSLDGSEYLEKRYPIAKTKLFIAASLVVLFCSTETLSKKMLFPYSEFP